MKIYRNIEATGIAGGRVPGPGRIPLVTVQNITGNHVIMRIAPGVYAMYAT